MRSKMSLCGMILALVLIISACASNERSNGSDAGASPKASTTQEKPVEITFWYAVGGKIGEANENLVKKFNESQNKIHVNASFQGTYNDINAKLQAAVVAKNQPDICVVLSTSTGPFATAGVLQDLTELAKRDGINFDNFTSAVLGNSYVNARLYSFPYLRSPNVLFINATMFKEAGLDPAGPKTWDELAKVAKQLTIPGKRAGLSFPLDIYRFESHVIQAGGKMIADNGKSVAFDSPEGSRALRFWLDNSRSGAFDIPVGASGTNSNEAARQNFMNQRAAMYYQNASDTATIREAAQKNGFELNIAPSPKDQNGNSTTIGSNLVILSGLSDAKKEAAWTFLKWLLDTEQVAYADAYTGYVPITKSAIESATMQKLYQESPVFRAAAEQAKYQVPRPMEVEYNEISKILTNEIERALVDPSVTAEAAIREAAKKSNALFKK